MLATITAFWRLGAKLGLVRRYGLFEPVGLITGNGPGPMMARMMAWLLTPASTRDTGYGQRLALALEAMGPTFIKLGQILATRGDLVGADMALALAGLQDKLPPFDLGLAKQAVAQALDQKLEAVFADFGPAIAAASIAQVHFATTIDGVEVAVKVLRPNVEQGLAQDLADMRALAAALEFFVPSSQRLRPKAIVETLAQSIAIELDLRMEAAACAELGEALVGDPDFRVPKVDWARTARRVMTLSRVEGIALSDMDAVIARHDRAALARKLVHGFLRQAMIGGFFHADLHPGNLFVAEDGALVAVDFGIMGRLSKDTSRFLALILKGFVERDYRGIAQVHVDAGYVGRDRDIEAFAQALRAVGEPVFDRPAAEISMGRLLTQLFEVTERFDMHTQPQLLMLQKTMVVVEGVARNLDPSMNIFEAARPIIEEWMREYLGPSAFMRDLRDAAGRLVDWIRQQRPPEPEPVTIPVPAKIEPAPPVLWHWLAAGAFILSLLAVALELLRHPG